MNHLITGLITSVALTFAAPVFAQDTPAPEGAELYFIGLEDGGETRSPITVQFGLRGMGVAPAGTQKDNTGHHHLFVNRPPLGQGEFGAEELELGIPSDENHIHFGGGQTETMIELPPGQHTLQLVLGDHGHVPHNPPVTSDVIVITVTE